jgi:putative transcriptional regulator
LIYIDQNRLDIKERKIVVCKLSTLLGERRMKISDVARATGIARATLDRYYHDRVKSFDRDVLERLCAFLKVKPGDLLQVVVQTDSFGESK